MPQLTHLHINALNCRRQEEGISELTTAPCLTSLTIDRLSSSGMQHLSMLRTKLKELVLQENVKVEECGALFECISALSGLEKLCLGTYTDGSLDAVCVRPLAEGCTKLQVMCVCRVHAC